MLCVWGGCYRGGVVGGLNGMFISYFAQSFILKDLMVAIVATVIYKN